MGLLDDAIREHLELKRRSGAAETEVSELEKEVLGAAPAPVPEPDAEVPPAEEPAVEIPSVPEAEAAVEVPRAEPEPWLDDPDEVPFDDALDHSSRRTTQPTTEFTAEDVAEAHGQPAEDFVAPDEEPGEDLLEETPDFLQETPEHDRLWFEQKPPRDFDFGA
jgi:hypothetical protein